MSTTEKAKEGVRLLKEAVLEYVAAHPGATTRDVQEALDLESRNEEGKFKDQLLWGIDNLLRAENKMRFDKTKRPQGRYII
jgi:hypothetical protein